jgi:arginase
VPLEAGDAAGTGIHRYSALRSVRDALRTELAAHDGPALVVGGDCGAAVGAVEHAASRHPNLAVLWLDAHPDLHTPDSSPSGAFAGMALRAVLGEGSHDLVLSTPIPAERVVLAGARDYDDAEEDAAARLGLTVVEATALADASALVDAVTATGADAVYVHVDLDVLDPSAMTGVTAAVPFGVQVAELVAALKRLRADVPLAGASIAGFAPGSPAAAIDDLGAILRVVGALA